ncbi:MAG: SO_0444 family Cu/Zn efflux transporter [Candidatus Omnitrophota bacterium]
MTILQGLTKEVWSAFNEAALYILFGILIAGIIQTFIDKDRIAKYLGKPGLKSVLLAALFGIPLPLCSCGVIPTAVSLRKNGASKGAVLSFLISTPESGISSIALSYAMLDPIMTFFRPLGALVTAVSAGVAENIFGQKDPEVPAAPKKACDCCHARAPVSHEGFASKFARGMRYAFVDLLGDLTKWLVLGILIGGAITYFVPQNLVERYLSCGWPAMLAMLVIGIPLYICASASTPIAAALIIKGMSPGVALVFLLAGPATNAAGILSVGKFLGKRSVVIYLASIAVCSVLLGLLLDRIYAVWTIDIKATIGHACDMFPYWAKISCSTVLAVLMANAILRSKNK